MLAAMTRPLGFDGHPFPDTARRDAVADGDHDSGRFVSEDHGGTLAVTSGTKNPDAAARVALELLSTPEALQDGTDLGLFLTQSQVLDSEAFLAREFPFFEGQQANREVFVPAANAYRGETYSPLAGYLYSTLGTVLNEKFAAGATAAETLDALQAALVSYAKQESFTVTEG